MLSQQKEDETKRVFVWYNNQKAFFLDKHNIYTGLQCRGKVGREGEWWQSHFLQLTVYKLIIKYLVPDPEL